VLVQDGGETAAFIADLIPTTAHLPLPWIMGYDLEPLGPWRASAGCSTMPCGGGWRLVFEHDPTVAWGVPVAEGKGLALRDIAEAPPARPAAARG
jgi:hypothetical protein